MNFYIANLLFVLIFVFTYINFRASLYSYLRLKKKSKSYIKKYSKGFLNYLLYTEINKDFPLGKWYYMNMVLLLFVAVFSVVVILCGYIRYMQIPITILSLLLAIIEVPVNFFCITISNKEWYGSPFVFFRKSPFGGRFPFSFILIDLLIPFVGFIFAYININLVFDI